MDSYESPRMPFEVIMTRFPQPPPPQTSDIRQQLQTPSLLFEKGTEFRSKYQVLGGQVSLEKPQGLLKGIRHAALQYTGNGVDKFTS